MKGSGASRCSEWVGRLLRASIMRSGVCAVVIAGVALVGFSGTQGGMTSASSNQSGQLTLQWMLSHGPSSRVFGDLSGTVAISARNVWTSGSGSKVGKAEYWNGHRWSVVPSPNPGSAHVRPQQYSSQFIGFSAVSSGDVWAVGYWGGECSSHPLIEHWNGSRWNIVRTGVRGNWLSYLYSVSFTSSHNAWAAGSYTVGESICGPGHGPPGTREAVAHPLIEHWNGHGWSVVRVPAPRGMSSSLTALSSVSPTNIWAAGNIESESSNRPLVEHWNGKRWRIVPIVGQSLKHRTLLGIDALSARNVWAVGQYWPPTTKHYWGEKTLIEHWNGSKWTIIASPNSGCHQNVLGSVGMLSTDDGWAFGSGNHCTHGPASRILAEHWNGVKWSVVNTSNPAAWRAYLAGHHAKSRAVTRLTHVLSTVSATELSRFRMYLRPLQPVPLVTRKKALDIVSASVRPLARGMGHLAIARLHQPLHRGGLAGISVVNAHNVWAVGSQPRGALIEHWNGRGWRSIQLPASASRSSTIAWPQLGGVAAVSPFDVWAVGAGGQPCTDRPVIEHWNGHAWTLTEAPSTVGQGIAYLTAVSADSPTDVWAVGTFDPGARVCSSGVLHGKTYPMRPLVLHWNGHAWIRTMTPVLHAGSTFNSVVALSANDVWAAGRQSMGNHNRTLIEHWNGQSWTVVASPHPGLGTGILRGVGASGPTDVWAVGTYSVSRTRQLTFIERWNGSSWSRMDSPNANCHLNLFNSVSMTSLTSGWAVGDGGYCGHSDIKPIAAHWNGSTWTLVSSQNTARGAYLAGVVTASPSSVWAVGASQGKPGHVSFGLIWRRVGK